jgi:hypothetical protein
MQLEFSLMQSVSWRIRSAPVWLSALAAFAFATASWAEDARKGAAPEKEVQAKLQYCKVCHGVSAQGSGATLSFDEKTRHLDRPWIGAMVCALDGRLRQRQGVIEYTRRPDCLFRIQIITSCANVILSDQTHVHPGDRLISLHVWNEQFPAFPVHGPTLA